METVKNLANGIKNSLGGSATTTTSNGFGHIPKPTKVGPASPLVDEHPTPLKVVIIGAGIGGLSAALSLRRSGHMVELYEQSRVANETGAAVHLAPNSNGVLRRWGIFAEQFGAVSAESIEERHYTGELVKAIDVRDEQKMWQHPWQFSHRVNLHEKLKALATAEDKGAVGTPAKLHTSSKVVSLDPAKGEVQLADGTTVTGDVILGADGIYSLSRTYIKDLKLFGSGKAAFRFLIPREAALADPETKAIGEIRKTLVGWYGDSRRVVMYPCNDDELLNFVCIHPDTESHATHSDEWNKQGDLNQVLKVYEGFDPALLALVKKVDPASVKVWQLMDMENLPSWTSGKLALLGDAAHPFTPHQGQGAGQAIEDAATLSVVLPKGTAPEAVSDRLKLYEKIRYERAHTIQEYSRQAGKDWVDGKPQVQMMGFTSYNFGHDEIDNSTAHFKKWKWAQKPNMYWRAPTGFGPFPGPRQDALGRSLQDGPQRTFSTTSIKFKTSRTYLETLFPNNSYKFLSPATVCEASFSVTELDHMQWLGGKGYRHLGLYIHGVGYERKDGQGVVPGTYLAVLFESLTDPIVSGREELGMPKLFCDIDIDRESQPGTARVTASWRGAQFFDMQLPDLQPADPAAEAGTIGGNDSDYGILTWRYIPAVGQPGKADAEYAVVVPHGEEEIKGSVKTVLRSSPQSAGFKAEGLDWTRLPTLHHVTEALASIPVYEVVSAKVVEGSGVPDVNAARRIE